jgi:hypothetical protein
MKNKVIALLIKHGNNANDVNKMIKNNYDQALNSYPDAKASFLANVIICL